MTIYKKLSYILWVKATIDTRITELTDWHKSFDPSWFLIIRISSAVLDRSLLHAVSAPKDAVSAMKALRNVHNDVNQPTGNSMLIDKRDASTLRRKVPYLEACLDIGNNGKEVMLVDSILCIPGIDVKQFARDIDKLAEILSHVDPVNFGLLKCQGFAAKVDPIISTVLIFPKH